MPRASIDNYTSTIFPAQAMTELSLQRILILMRIPIATTSPQKSSLTFLASSGRLGRHLPTIHHGHGGQNSFTVTWPIERLRLTPYHRQIRQGIANNTKGTAFVVYEDVMDAKQACDKLNGFNFQNRYLVGMFGLKESSLTKVLRD